MFDEKEFISFFDNKYNPGDCIDLSAIKIFIQSEIKRNLAAQERKIGIGRMNLKKYQDLMSESQDAIMQAICNDNGLDDSVAKPILIKLEESILEISQNISALEEKTEE